MNGGEKPPVTETTTFLMLPNDLLLNCLARVSRLYYPTLSLVSKRFRSLLASLELYDTRTLLGCTESCLYLCLLFPRDSNTKRWFTLCRRPTQITDQHPNPNPRWFTPCFAPYRTLMNRTRKKEKKPSDNILVSIPTRNSPSVCCWPCLIAVGYNIYKIGGRINGLPSSKVFYMDCRSHTWHEAPNMRVARKWPIENVLDGKIYVAEGSIDFDPSNWIECFDLKTQIWEHVPSPDAEIRGSFVYKSLAIEGKLYMFWDMSRRMVYKPKENKWDEVGLMDLPLSWLPDSSCVIDNVLYRFGWSKKLEWYDFEGRSWRILKGLKKLPKLPKGYNLVKLVDYGGKIAVLWEKDAVWKKKKKIWCAEISLERCNEHEIYGKVEWCDVVLTVPKSSCSTLQLLAVTV